MSAVAAPELRAPGAHSPRANAAPAARGIAADGRKPLHLDGRERPIAVRARGPALEIEVGPVRSSVPIARLARVVSRGRVHWDGAALELCLRNGVAVAFVDDRGQPLGGMLPLRANGSALGELLQQWVERARWREVYENWLAAQRHRILRCWRRRCELGGRPLDESAWREAVRRIAFLGQMPETPGAGACYAQTLALLLRCGLRSRYRAFDGGVLELAADLAALAHCERALALGGLAMALSDGGPLDARGTEGAIGDTESTVLDLLARLRRRIAEEIEPWP